jgi:hypothetical protein
MIVFLRTLGEISTLVGLRRFLPSVEMTISNYPGSNFYL